MNTEEYDERLAQLAMIIHVSRIDADITDEEQAFIDAMARRLGVKEEDKKRLQSGEIQTSVHIPTSEWERVEQFHICMMTSMTSGEIDESEVAFCHRLGSRLGLRGIALDNAIRLFKKHHPDPVPMEEIKRVYQLGHN